MARTIVDILDLTPKEIDDIIAKAIDIAAHPVDYAQACAGKKLATLFYEPSTRTRLSFEAAMYELGGNVLGFSDATCSSASKGESIVDTVRTISAYADIVAMRNPKEGAALVASRAAQIPVINAGDGGHCHPTQTLTDLLTIYRLKGGFENLTIGFCGDLKYGRTVHSLITALSRYAGIKCVLISPKELRVPGYVRKGALLANNIPYEEVTDLSEALPSLDILYMTRIQRERFASPEEYERLRGCYVLDTEKMKLAGKDMYVLHPLPRVDEIDPRIDDDPRAKYFEQVVNGKHARMALILKLLSERHVDAQIPPALQQLEAAWAQATVEAGYVCQNSRCVTQTEPNLYQLFKCVNEPAHLYRCCYCEHKPVGM